MNVRELLTDAPALDVLLERCMSHSYDLDAFDFFYMQALNEQNKQRYPLCSWGLRKCATIAVGGGYTQQALTQLGYSPAVLSANKDLVTTLVSEELTGDFDFDSFSAQGTFLRTVNPPLSSSLAPLKKKWADLGEQYLAFCRSPNSELYASVDFSSPVFKGTKRFKPFLKRKQLNHSDIMLLESFFADTGYAFEVVRLPYFSLDAPFFRK